MIMQPTRIEAFLALSIKRTFLLTALAIPALLVFALTLSLGDTRARASGASNDVFLEGGGGTYNLRGKKSLLDTRFKSVVRQRYDFSCGSAAVATLLTYHYGHPVEEINVLNAMYEAGDKAKIRREGFSLLDMKNYLESIGYHAEGYRESLDKLTKVGIPSIALMNRRGYMHFVVVKSVTKDKVSVGDPTLGLRIYDRKEFEKMWNGILFVLLDDKRIANAAFNSRENWSTNGNPHFRHMLDRGTLSDLTVDISITPNYY